MYPTNSVNIQEHNLRYLRKIMNWLKGEGCDQVRFVEAASYCLWGLNSVFRASSLHVAKKLLGIALMLDLLEN